MAAFVNSIDSSSLSPEGKIKETDTLKKNLLQGLTSFSANERWLMFEAGTYSPCAYALGEPWSEREKLFMNLFCANWNRKTTAGAGPWTNHGKTRDPSESVIDCEHERHGKAYSGQLPTYVSLSLKQFPTPSNLSIRPLLKITPQSLHACVCNGLLPSAVVVWIKGTKAPKGTIDSSATTSNAAKAKAQRQDHKNGNLSFHLRFGASLYWERTEWDNEWLFILLYFCWSIHSGEFSFLLHLLCRSVPEVSFMPCQC